MDHILKELTNLIAIAQKCDKKGIKAQKVCAKYNIEIYVKLLVYCSGIRFV